MGTFILVVRMVSEVTKKKEQGKKSCARWLLQIIKN